MYGMFLDGAAIAFSTYGLLLLLAGVLTGIVFGAIPGFNPSTAMVLLLPISYHMEPAHGVIFLSGIAGAGIYGGSITAILFRAPGTIGSIITAIDGYEMTKKGRGVEALGISTMSSTLGGIFGGIALLALAPPLTVLATKISYPEIVLIILWTFLLIGAASQSFMKTILSALIGLLLASIGADPINGLPRMTFGTFDLYEGVELLTAIVGIFCISELIKLVAEKSIVTNVKDYRGTYSEAFRGALFALRAPFIVLRSSALGVLIGVLPAAGAALANAVAYEVQKRTDRYRDSYGAGEPRGLVAAEAANNATEGASLIPTMTLGIPGSNIGAILMAAMIIHGVAVGPQIFERNGDLAYALIVAIIIANPMMLIIGIALSKHAAVLTKINVHSIVPSLLLLVLIGSFSVRNSTFDLWMLLLFGAIGFIMIRNGYSLIAFVLPFVLGKPLEQAILISMKYSGNDPSIFYRSEISKIMIFVILGTVAFQLRKMFKKGEVPCPM